MSSVTVGDLFADKWRNFALLARGLVCKNFPKLDYFVSTYLPDDEDEALQKMVAYLPMMRIFITTRAEEELLSLLEFENDKVLIEETRQFVDSLNSHTKDKLWRYGVFFLDVVDTLTTKKQ